MKNISHIIAYIGLGLLVGFFLGRMDLTQFNQINPIIDRSCIYNGQSYQHGEGFMDSCNSCSCQNGQINCTLMACEEDLIQP